MKNSKDRMRPFIGAKCENSVISPGDLKFKSICFKQTLFDEHLFLYAHVMELIVCCAHLNVYAVSQLVQKLC